MIYDTPISPLGFCQDGSKISLNVFKLCSLRFATRFDKKKKIMRILVHVFRLNGSRGFWVAGLSISVYPNLQSQTESHANRDYIQSFGRHYISQVDSDHQVDTLSLKYKVDNRPLINTKQAFSFGRNNGIKQLECNIKRKPGSPIVDQQASRHYPHSLKDRQ